MATDTRCRLARALDLRCRALRRGWRCAARRGWAVAYVGWAQRGRCRVHRWLGPACALNITGGGRLPSSPPAGSARCWAPGVSPPRRRRRRSTCAATATSDARCNTWGWRPAPAARRAMNLPPQRPACAQVQPEPSVDLSADLRELGGELCARGRNRRRLSRNPYRFCSFARSGATGRCPYEEAPVAVTSRQQVKNELMVCSVIWRFGPAIRLTVTSASRERWAGTAPGFRGTVRPPRSWPAPNSRGWSRSVADHPRGCRAGHQAPAQRERLGVPTDPECAHRLLIGCAPGVTCATSAGRRRSSSGNGISAARWANR